MAVSLTTPEHPMLGCAAEMPLALDRVADVDPSFMTTRDKATALIELARCGNQLRGLTLRILAGADDVALEHGARSARDVAGARDPGRYRAVAWRPAGWPGRWTVGGGCYGRRCPTAG